MDEKTLLDYFAAHTPAEIPEWFQPKTAYAKPTHPEPAPEIAGPAKDWLKDGCYDFAGCFDRSDSLSPYYFKNRPLAERFEDAVQAYREQCRAIDASNVEHRYFAWRWHYAEMMMKHRKEH